VHFENFVLVTKRFLHQNIEDNADLRTYMYQALSDKTWQYICTGVV